MPPGGYAPGGLDYDYASKSSQITVSSKTANCAITAITADFWDMRPPRVFPYGNRIEMMV